MDIRDILREYYVINRYELFEKGSKKEDMNFMEMLRDLDTVWEGDESEYRWYIELTRVVKVGDHFIAYRDYKITGDDSPSDMGLEYDFESVHEVFPKEVMTTIYVTKDEL